LEVQEVGTGGNAGERGKRARMWGAVEERK